MRNTIFIIPFIFMAWQPLLSHTMRHQTDQPNPVPVSKHKFIVIAHRGDHTQYPENTLAAYAAAITAGADYVEIDLRTTKDGHLVSLHNDGVDRMTNGKGLIKEMLWKDLQQLTINGGTSAQSLRIPTFEQILQLCKGKIYLYIDFKEADPAVVDPILRKYGMQDQVLVYINTPEQYRTWRKVNPRIPLMLSPPDKLPDDSTLQQFIESYKPDILDGDCRQYTKNLLAVATASHLPVWPDAQSNNEGPATWAGAITVGLQGLQTDHPEALIAYLTEKGLR